MQYTSVHTCYTLLSLSLTICCIHAIFSCVVYASIGNSNIAKNH
uniref:Uncharacterized protein n=1 Tax=Anguilla anguilla TaxID=7936 RepID=A0A0E9QZ46_ANGAN